MYPFILPPLPNYVELTEEILREYRAETTDDQQAKDQEKIHKQILDNQKKLDIIENYAQKLVYMQPAISWQLKQIIRSEPRLEPAKPKMKIQDEPPNPNAVTYKITCTKCPLDLIHTEKSLEIIKKFHEELNQKNKYTSNCLHNYQYKLVEQGSS